MANTVARLLVDLHLCSGEPTQTCRSTSFLPGVIDLAMTVWKLSYMRPSSLLHGRGGASHKFYIFQMFILYGVMTSLGEECYICFGLYCTGWPPSTFPLQPPLRRPSRRRPTKPRILLLHLQMGHWKRMPCRHRLRLQALARPTSSWPTECIRHLKRASIQRATSLTGFPPLVPPQLPIVPRLP